MGFPISADWKGDNYNLILVIVDQLTKMVYYKPVKVIIDAPSLAKVINIVVRHHRVLELILIDQGSFFTSKFWFSLCYFLEIKQKLFIAFHPQRNGKTERQNSIIKAYLRIFVNW